jgi:hypothetical protein
VPENIHDLNLQNAWVEGVEGDGIGEYIAFHFNWTTQEITTIVIANGYVQTEKTYRENSRPKKLKMYIDDNPYAILNLHDLRAEQIFTFEPSLGPDKNPQWTIKFEILEVYKGDKYEDTAISEIYFAKLSPTATGVSGAFDGVITAQVENGGILNSLVSELRAEILVRRTAEWEPVYETLLLSGNYANGGFIVTLPQTPDAKYLRNIVDAYFYPQFINNLNANYFVFDEILGYDRNGSLTATIKLHEKKNDILTEYYVSFCYVDRDVIVKGHAEGNHFDLNLKKGWNKVYTASYLESGNITQNTDPSYIIPSDVYVKWQFVGG